MITIVIGKCFVFKSNFRSSTDIAGSINVRQFVWWEKLAYDNECFHIDKPVDEKLQRTYYKTFDTLADAIFFKLSFLEIQ